VNARKIQLKLYAEGDVDLDQVVRIFHGWIRDKKLGELLVDVADYQHVPDGPGIALIGHASDYYLDLGEGRPGLLYSRKRDAPDDVLRDALERLLEAAALLEAEGVRFRTDELLLRVNDRLAPDDFASLEGALSALLPRVVDHFAIEPSSGPKERVAARVRAPGAGDVNALRERLGAPLH
jgi:hypothetical protein